MEIHVQPLQSSVSGGLPLYSRAKLDTGRSKQKLHQTARKEGALRVTGTHNSLSVLTGSCASNLPSFCGQFTNSIPVANDCQMAGAILAHLIPRGPKGLLTSVLQAEMY